MPRPRPAGLPAGAPETVEPVSPTEAIVSAFAYDAGRPGSGAMLALFCDGRLAGLDRPRRIRKDLAARPGFEGTDRYRIGYRMRIPRASCGPDAAPLAVAVGEDGRMAVLAGPERR